MRLRVNPNRMEYSRLRRKLALALRGYKLLKEKQDGLMQEFLKIVRSGRNLRQEVEADLQEYYMNYIDAVMATPGALLYEALMCPAQRVEPEVMLRNKLGVRVPVFNFTLEADKQSYGFLTTPGQLDSAIDVLGELLPKMIELAGVEKQIELMAHEIERTRRRVNALEYVLIPNLKETIKYISIKLSENEMAIAVRLMRIKNIVRKVPLSVA
ncbi:MAG: V-type ATP synthase subunit D [bacterium]